MATRHMSPRARKVAAAASAPRAPRNVAGPDHAARPAESVASAVAAVDAWFESGKPSGNLDLTDSTVAAVDAAKLRASELGCVVMVRPGKRVVLELRADSPTSSDDT